MPVHMELKRIIISEVHEQQVILLKEVDGDRSFHIMIGIFEATSIDRRVKRLPSPRPLTHDLVANVVEQLGGEISDIYISELRDHTYYAKLRIRHNGELIEVPYANPYALEFENLSAAIRGEAEPLLGAPDALAQAAAIEALYRSAST